MSRSRQNATSQLTHSESDAGVDSPTEAVSRLSPLPYEQAVAIVNPPTTNRADTNCVRRAPFKASFLPLVGSFEDLREAPEAAAPRGPIQ